MRLMKALADDIAFTKKAREPVKDCISFSLIRFRPSILSITSNSTWTFSFGILILREAESNG